ncbi:hypothetical protein PGB90_008558 [Kerria lacca]
MNLLKANGEIMRTIRILNSMKESPEEITVEIEKLIEDGKETENKSVFCGTEVAKIRKGKVNKRQFLQALFKQMENRFIQDEDPVKNVLNDIQIIRDIFSQETDDNIGEKSAKRVARHFNLPEQTAVRDFHLRNVNSTSLCVTKVRSVAIVECQRGFSQINNIVTDLRINLTTRTIWSIMFIRIHGVDISKFKPKNFKQFG